MVAPIGESANILNFPPIQPTSQPNPTLNYDTNYYKLHSDHNSGNT